MTVKSEVDQERGMLSVRLEPEIEGRLADLAAKTGRTKSYYVREAIIQFLEDMEDRYIAIERLEHPAKRWSLDELERDLDVDRGDR
jgi:RHH-type rel operon transcriptional repressor/antitoxin RelB